MHVARYVITMMFGLAAITSASADAADPLFHSQDTLNVEITAPLSTLVRERSETDYLSGVFSYKDADGTPVTLDVRVRARGNFRYRNCELPPLTLNFRKSQVKGTLFDQQDKLKMVVHCNITRRYEQSVLREYLAYRLLNSVTERSFRVRLLNVVWVDSDERRGSMVRSAFLIEHKDRLGARIGLAEQDIASAELEAIEPDHLNLLSLYQYLIGNVDFSPIAGSNGECCHNYLMFGSSTDALVPVPYDFDFAGFVNAPNAVPDTERGVERLGQRVYRGYCANNDSVANSVSAFQRVRETLYAQVADQEELEPSVRQNIAEYMDEFYAVIDDPGSVKREIIDKCL
ncbi:MAG: hypothetical protein P8Y54_13580 [Xanthomonadales bacterium]